MAYFWLVGIALFLTFGSSHAARPGKCDQSGTSLKEAAFSLSAKDLIANPGTILRTIDMGSNSFCDSGTFAGEESIPITETFKSGMPPDADGYVAVTPGLAIRFTLTRSMRLDSREKIGAPAVFGAGNWPTVWPWDHLVRTMYYDYSLVATLKRVAGSLSQGQYNASIGDVSAASGAGSRTDTLTTSILVPGPACKVSLPFQTVKLAPTDTSVLNALSIGEAAKVGTSFKIRFDCVHTAKKMELTLFDANAVGPANYFALANSTAEGVALQLESVDKGSVIPPGVPIALAGPVGAGSYSPEFVVKYVKTDAVVKPGSVKASAIFTVTYD